MNVGLILPLFSGDPQRVASFARRAEALGYDGVFAFDHFFPPGAPTDRPSLEAFTSLSAVAAATERVTVGTLVTRASIRPAGLLAKMAAGVDDISSGRMVLGIGTGDPIDKPEHQAYGLTYLEKGERREHLIETVRAVKALFAGSPWPGGGRIPPVSGPLLPRPVTRGGPPVWVGGFADEVVRIAAREADAWNGWGMSIPEFARKANLLREAAEGRDVAATWAGIVLVGEDEDDASRLLDARDRKGLLETNVWSGSVRSLAGWLDGLEGAGASWVVLVAAGPGDRIELIAEHALRSGRLRG
ncbi:MAG TPA: LLM class flavin-dependent oxidoreductase [Actinomycetota bacterium]|jgi:alkanesulfonate monooxygenase SsuD/methylene tetrahydromethanopterin reductase-like flavin-dependent oxidoreductase (luciferase family)